jgi:hypothetical protein
MANAILTILARAIHFLFKEKAMIDIRKLGPLVFVLIGILFFGGARLSAEADQPMPKIFEPLPDAPLGQTSSIQGPIVASSNAAASADGAISKALIGNFTAPIALPRAPYSNNAPNSTSATQTDRVRQAQAGTVNSWLAVKQFAGLDAANSGANGRPDMTGDVGLDHYIQAVSSAVGIYSKRTGQAIATFYLNNLFANATAPCNTNNKGSPMVIHDPVSSRWIIADVAWSNADNGPYYECIAVSKTTDPVNGGWWLYAFLIDSNWLGDSPKLGAWSDGIYMAANMFDVSGGGTTTTWQGANVWALNRNDLLNGSPVRQVKFTISGSAGFGILPGNFRGSPFPSSLPNFFANIVAPNKFQLWKFRVDWNTPSNSTFTGPTVLTVANFTMPCNAGQITACIPQKNSPELVDAVGDRLMTQLQYRKTNGVESLWATHTVASASGQGNPTGLRWYEIRNPNGTPTIFQQSTFQPDANYRWLGSLAVNRDGDVAIGYSVSSTSMYPAIGTAGRVSFDPPNSFGLSEATFIQGTGSQNGGANRWGSYSSMTLDPQDGCTFWYTNEYYATTGANWQTRIGAFRIAVASAYPAYPSYPAPGRFILFIPWLGIGTVGNDNRLCR